jgi:hypothetical protein
MSAPEWLLHKHRFEAMSLRVDEVDEDDLLILGVHEHAQPPDAQLLAVQQVRRCPSGFSGRAAYGVHLAEKACGTHRFLSVCGQTQSRRFLAERLPCV